MNKDKLEAGVRLILEGLNVDPLDHNFDRTPQRVAAVYAELFATPETEWPVFDEKYTDVVLMRGHRAWTLCPHHLLPVELRVSVGYVPNGKVLGASKLARVVQDCNRYPMTQEALTAAIVQRLDELTEHTARGTAIFMIGEHDCFRMRGVRTDADLVTYKFSGVFDQEPERQRLFLDLVGGHL